LKVPNIKFHENQSSGSHAVTCAQMDGRIDEHREDNMSF